MAGAPSSRMRFRTQYRLLSGMVLAFLCLQAKLLQLQGVFAAPAPAPAPVPSSELLPALGNSVALVATTRAGVTAYTCASDSKSWGLKNSTAVLVSSSNPSSSSAVLGDLIHVEGEEASVIQWSLLNSLADQTESGQNYTIISGRLIAVENPATTGPLTQLYQINSRNEPILVRYSFVLIMSSVDNGAAAPPTDATCTAGEVVTVPYRATFTFYTQDLVPPPLDTRLAVPKSQTILQSLFASGTARWAVAGANGDDGTVSWSLRSASAGLADVPGGPRVGTLTVVPEDDDLAVGPAAAAFKLLRATWVVPQPGWNVSATLVGSASLAPQDWPWQLYRNVQGEQKISYVQFLSTKGGMPPSAGNVSADAGLTYSSDFSGVSWFYTPLPST